ncbi:glycosyltransferase family 4 protein [Paradesertivirga mongoliensis]|uniref:Glycosyltransferase family 4 protein n=1 Tax=Paradesertivirga mongoliensis TaxID=2100740 RepID=A0ABW4ZG72_9SPHI|nr:glycosyltransferase family 4 protein [Pedobacter mongoliensis]
MPKKILFLTLRTFSITGGIEKVCRVLTRALYDLSEKSLIEPKAFSMYDKSSDRDAKYILRTQFKGFNGSRILYSLAAIREGIRSDTVILSHINLLFLALVIKRLSAKTRVILFVHGIEVWRDLKSWKADFLRKDCDEIWAVSDYTSKEIQKRHSIPSQRIKVIHNCLDPFLEIPVDFNKPADLIRRYNLNIKDKVLFTLTRLTSSELYKGYDQVIAIIPRLLTLYPTLKYLIAGKADTEERSRLSKLIKDRGLERHVVLLGFVPEEELSEHFLLSDVFVMPSRKEGFGIVFIEAAACGCKTIAGNQDGSVDALMNGRLGTLISPTDTEAIFQAIVNNLESDYTTDSALKIQAMCVQSFNYEAYYQKIKERICDK